MKTKLRRASSETWTRQLAELVCRRRGWHLEHTSWTERFLRGKIVVTRKHDLWGCDGFAFTGALPEPGVFRVVRGMVGLQWTSASNVPARVRKLRGLPTTRLLLACGVELRVWGFEENGELREVEIQ